MINLVKKIKPNTAYFHVNLKVDTFDHYFFTNDVLLDYYDCSSIDSNLFYRDKRKTVWWDPKRKEIRAYEAVKAVYK